MFIGRLSPHARERDVEKFFKGYGHIREINLKNGFGFVEFDDHRDADDAVYELNGKELCSERVTIEHARSRRGRGGGPGMGGRFSPRFGGYRKSHSGGSRYGPPVRTEHRIIVDNLSSRISWQKEQLSGMGERREWPLFFLCCGECRTAVSQKEKERTETTERKAKQRLRKHARSRSLEMPGVYWKTERNAEVKSTRMCNWRSG